jgi:hypothetical protein
MPETPDKNMKQAWSTIKQYYDHFNVPKTDRYGTLKLTMFKVGSAAKLRGKAGEIRAIGPCILRLWQNYANPADNVHAKIEACLATGVRMEAILDEHRDEFALPGLFFARVSNMS